MTDGATIPRPAPAIASGPAAIRIDERDNVAVAIRPIPAGDHVDVGGESVVARQEIPAGHKIALSALEPEQSVIKYGVPIGLATQKIERGDWIHSHN
ncbi:MAG: UxaA family hydrolase, partial [Gemmatimonadaceae bacterium]